MNTNSLVQLGEAIRGARNTKHMTQATLAQRVGVSRPTITQLECGNVFRPRVWILAAIAAVLEVPAAPFFAELGVDLEDVATAQLHWLCRELDAPNFRRLILIGHALLQEQVGS